MRVRWSGTIPAIVNLLACRGLVFLELCEAADACNKARAAAAEAAFRQLTRAIEYLQRQPATEEAAEE